MAIDYPLINGVRYDFGSIVFHINADLVLGVKEIAYKNSRDRGEVRGTPLQRLAKTRGQYPARSSGSSSTT